MATDPTAAATTLIARLSRALPELARMYALPALTPVTSPVDETMATAGSLLAN
jgi:hypothetical protein